jgi:hypothetical protein
MEKVFVISYRKKYGNIFTKKGYTVRSANAKQRITLYLLQFHGSEYQDFAINKEKLSK